MVKELSAIEPSAGGTIDLIYILLSVGLLVVSVAILFEVFGSTNPYSLGRRLSAGFAILALLIFTHYRRNFAHRLLIEDPDEAD